MKNTKIFWLVGIIAIIVAVGFSMASCDNGSTNNSNSSGIKTLSGTITVVDGDNISFTYGRQSSAAANSCVITTNLPDPDTTITLALEDAETKTTKKTIVVAVSEASFEVEWTATVTTGAITENDTGLLSVNIWGTQ